MEIRLSFHRSSEELPEQDKLVLGLWRDSYILCTRRGEGDEVTWYDANNDLHEGLCEDGGPIFWARLPSPVLQVFEVRDNDMSPCEEMGKPCVYGDEEPSEECVHCGWAPPGRE